MDYGWWFPSTSWGVLAVWNQRDAEYVFHICIMGMTLYLLSGMTEPPYTMERSSTGATRSVKKIHFLLLFVLEWSVHIWYSTLASSDANMSSLALAERWTGSLFCVLLVGPFQLHRIQKTDLTQQDIHRPHVSLCSQSLELSDVSAVS